MDLQMQASRRTTQTCAACRVLRRRCDNNCLLAPYFPADNSNNFAPVHKVFGASNVTKLLQRVEETKKGEAVKSMVHEAKTRLKDPIYGSAGIIFCLEKQVKDLELQLELIKAQLIESQSQIDQLLMDVDQFNHFTPINDAIFERHNLSFDGGTNGCGPFENSAIFACSWETPVLHELHG